MKTVFSLKLWLLGFAFTCLAAGAQAEELPKDLKWETNQLKEPFADPKAKKGGTVSAYLLNFPLTLRYVGPDSNGAFRRFINENRLPFVTQDPNNPEIWIPLLATHWAFGKDKRSVYYKINPKAQFADGKPVKGSDFEFTITMMRSEHIIAPWYNQYYTEQIESVKAFKDKDGTHVVKVSLPQPKPDLLYYTNISPTPEHFYKLDKDFVKNYNWKIAPNTGPYSIDKIKKGKSITFKRKKDWWAKDLPQFVGRFNVDRVVYKVIRDPSVAFENLKKANIDFMDISWPEYWHEKSDDELFKKGYIHKGQFYNDVPRPDYLLMLNTSLPLLSDINVRKGFAHAMNVDRVLKKVLRGDYELLNGISRGFGEFTNDKIKARAFDLKKADEYLKKAGWIERNGDGIRVKDGKPLSVTVTYAQSNMAPRLVVLREEAKKAGIDLKLNEMDAAARWNYFLEKKHEIAYVSWGTFYRPQYYGQYHSTFANKPQNNNFTNIANPKLDKLIEDYRASTDHKERTEKAKKIQQMVHDEAVVVPLFEVPYYRLAYWGWIKFPKIPSTKSTDELEPFNYTTGGTFWIDKEEKKKIKQAKKKGQALPEVVIVDKTYQPK